MCPPAYTVSCGGGVACPMNTECVAEGGCRPANGYWGIHCDGTPRPCSATDPCTEAYAARCHEEASVVQYSSLRADLRDVALGCVAPLEPCGEIHCYDPSVHICCAGTSSELDLCFRGDACNAAGHCDDVDRAAPP